MLQEQNRAMQEQYKAQQKMLLDMIGQQQEAHEREMKALKESKKEEVEDLSKKPPKPTLQKLTASDNVEHFLATFERIAMQQKWSKEVWATQIAGLLSGKAMAAYAALTPEDSTDYDKVKEAILRRYEINEETYRQRFRQDRKKGEESYREYADRLNDHFKRWVASQSIALEELVTIEQFLVGLPEDLRIWLRERKPTSLRQAATLADDYALARRSSQKFNSSKKMLPPVSHVCSQETLPTGQGWDRRPNHSGKNDNGRSQTNWRGDKKCFQCGKFGHLMYNCPERQVKPALSGVRCDEVAWNKGSQKYLRRGRLNGKPVQMLIDTGCTKTMVSTDWLDHDCMDYDQTEKILCVHGDMVCYPTARVRLQLGRWSKTARVVVAPEIPVPVLLGTDMYDLNPNKPVLVTTRAQAKRNAGRSAMASGGESECQGVTEGLEEKDTNEGEQDNDSTGTAEMEDIELRREEPASTESQEFDPLQANVNDIKQWQIMDPTLARAREAAEENETDARVGFYYENGLLYRKWRPEGSSEGDVRECQQLVLPQQCRQAVLRLAHDVPMAGHMGISKTKDRILQ